ncbi:alpha/beta fold hydrolase [Lysinimonas soli]|uniref:Alpha/beta fold hydrolase n=1 Tax=Lysinimonas soli TaxID=1074233 RepID=A0ABW0NNA6_9MICO
MSTAHVNGIDINYELDGDGPETVVLINGLADELETWAYQMPALLDAGYRVLRFDNRGIGRSEKPAGPYSSQLMADDAKALVDSLGLRDFHLMGVSMGGMIAQSYALSYPGDLRSLTLACTYAAPGPFCSRMFSMWADTARVMGVPMVMRDVTLWAFTLDFFRERESELIEFETAMRFMDQPVHAYLAQLAVIQEHDATVSLPALSAVPTLVLAGEEDILIPTRLSRELADLIPGSTFVTTPGGHGCIWEHPDDFNSAFVGFLLENGQH